MVFSVVFNECKSLTIKKSDRKRFLREPWTTKKTSKRILDQIKPHLSLKAQMTKLQLLYFGQLIRRTNSLDKTIILEVCEGKRGRGRPGTRWIGTIRGVMIKPLISPKIQTGTGRSGETLYGCQEPEWI